MLYMGLERTCIRVSLKGGTDGVKGAVLMGLLIAIESIPQSGYGIPP